MISTEDAIKLLKCHDTSSCRQSEKSIYYSLSGEQAQEIAELILYLSSKCDLEVNELLGADANGN